MPGKPYLLEESEAFGDGNGSDETFSVLKLVLGLFRVVRFGNRYMKRLLLLISLNVAYSTTELAIGLFTGRVGNETHPSLVYVVYSYSSVSKEMLRNIGYFEGCLSQSSCM